MRRVIISIGVLFILTSCSKAPKCNDSDVVDRVKDICVREAKIQIAYDKLYEEDIYVLENTYTGKQMLEMFSMMGGGSGAENTLKKMKEEASTRIRKMVEDENFKYEKYDKFIHFADSVINGSDIKIKNIRTSNIEEEIGKCNCNADFISTGRLENTGKIINYSAQITEDKVIYVEVDFEE